MKRFTYDKTMRTGLVFLVAALALIPAAGHAQQTPTLKIQTRIVLLDISVFDKQGHPVTDLRPDEFRIYEQKAPQAILSFEPPSAHAVPADLTGKVVVNSTADLAKVGDAPITILVLDELNMNNQDEIYYRDKLIKWLARQPPVLPQPTAVTAINYTTFQLLRDFTQDRDTLLAILKKHSAPLAWRSENTGRLGAQASEDMFSTLGALERISQAMRGVPGRKNLIWVGDGFPAVNIGDTGRTEADEITAALRRLSNIMLHARVTLSVVGNVVNPSQTVTIETQADSDMASSANYDGFVLAKGNMDFGGLAPPTGGHAYNGRNDLDAEVDRSIAEGAEYYTISYRPSQPNDNPKQYRNIHVELTRPGLTVETRDGYFGEPKEPPPLDKTQTQQLAFDLNGAAVSPLSFTDLHMSAERVDPEDYLVHASARDMTWRDLPDGRRHADLIVMAACLNKQGKMLAHTFTLLGSNTEASLESISLVNAALHVHVTPPAGTARIRFVVRDAIGGRVGTADLPL